MFNIRQRRQQIAARLAEQGAQTIRAIATATGIPKSSVHRHQQGLKQGHQYPEAALWQTDVGEEWLKRLVVATIYVFGLTRGVGAESLSECFYKLGLEHFIGVSVSSLRHLQTVLEEKVLGYQQVQQERLSQACQSLPALCVGVDETWFESTILVMMALSSGYLLVEETAANHRYETWQQVVEPVVKQWGSRIQYCVSDRAKALIKLALNDLGCASIADLFHAMRKLSQGLGFDLERRLTHLRRRLQEQPPQGAQAVERDPVLQAEYAALQTAQSQFSEHLAAISLGLHPFDIRTLGAVTTEQVAVKLSQQVDALKQFQQQYQLKDAPGGVDKFKRQIEVLTPIVDLWWQWVEHSLAAHELAQPLLSWLTVGLLPLCYWQYQSQRTDKPTLKAQYRDAYQRAHNVLKAHPLTRTLEAEVYRYWYSWASEMVTKFQRTTAAVEGRNGYLGQIHHSRRRLSDRQLQVMSVIHNFDLKRLDGSTAAQRLFKQPHPDLFQTVLAQMHDLPLPRQRAKAAKAQILDAANVPA
ncbi:hypothetical protein XM38_035960 [Halomicronema hongdechloris C2206]|uniref:HTH iclR-type domain-containing protein n=1 Tax=Halomicronema hongdechloris C2206 TaxID=1641165 RepID=A0A1Z3HQR9_9CYAN|nr:DUF6399 domain-containing protein [Halomicronema hongdechloris]ASC72638.1 hypothetical protein XM38_035960 [Halomicronema hongdechloris C2206]